MVHLQVSAFISDSLGLMYKVHTMENRPRFRRNLLDVYRQLFRLRRNVAACSNDDERVCFAIQVFQVKPLEEDRRSSYDTLAE